MKRQRRNRFWAGLLAAALLAGCGKQVPRSVIQRDKMEQILYDYHLGVSMSGNPGSSENYQKEAYKQYVFAKHQVTEAEFDSSMVWYTRHADELAAIYKKLGTRFRDEKKEMQGLLSLRGGKPSVSRPGDTVDLWYDHRLYWLADAPLVRKVAFEIPADSNFMEKDAFRWSATYVFLSEREQKAIMGFSVIFGNDSVAGKVEEITRPGTYALDIRPDSAFAIQSVNGFIYYRDKDSAATVSPGVLVHHLSLMRYHAGADTASVAGNIPAAGEEAKADSVAAAEKADSVPAGEAVDSVPADVEKNVPVRLNPREMKENNSPSSKARAKKTRPRK